MRHLSRFYAVTVSGSVYQAEIGKKGYPFLLKIGVKENITSIGRRIDNGSMLAIARFLFLFIPEEYGHMHQMTGIEREPGMVNTYYWGGHASHVVALFLKKKDALECLKAENFQPCDFRWENRTIEVLKRVGDNHPCCSISTSPNLCLLPSSKWQNNK